MTKNNWNITAAQLSTLVEIIQSNEELNSLYTIQNSYDVEGTVLVVDNSVAINEMGDIIPMPTI